MSLALLLSVMAAAYNNLINRWEPFHGPAYVPVNLAFAAAVTVVAAVALDLSGRELGLQADIGSAAIALTTVALFGVGAVTLARSRRGHLIADRRVAGLRGGRFAFHALVRIPLGTAVVEEVVFRGVLFAAWRAEGYSAAIAATYASFAFGLWHITPTIIGVRMNESRASTPKLAVAVVGAVVLTAAVGLALTWVRVETDGLIGPIVLHAGINSSAAVAAVIANRRRRSEADPGSSG